MLYPSDADVRSIATFLVSKLPQDDADADAGQELESALEQSLKQAMGKWVSTPWTAPKASKAGPRRVVTRRLHRPEPFLAGTPDQVQFVSTIQPLVSARAPSMPGLLVALHEADGARGERSRLHEADLERAGMEGVQRLFAGRRGALASQVRTAFSQASDGAGFGAGSALSLDSMAARIRASRRPAASVTGFKAKAIMTQEKAAAAPEDVGAAQATEAGGKTEEELAAEREVELEDLARQLAAAEAEAAALQHTTADAERSAVQLRSNLSDTLASTRELETKLREAKSTLALVPQADTIIPELQGKCSAVADRLVELAAQWELRRRPLVEGIRRYKVALAKRRARCEEMVSEMSAIRSEMAGMGSDIKAREAKVGQLSAQLQSLPQDHNRNEYTKRILEIVREVRKQQGEIGKVMAEIKGLQRAAGMSADKLGRTTAATESLIFAAAQAPGKKQTTHIEAYRNLTMMQELFHDLRTTVADIAAAENEERDVQTHIDDLKRHVDPARTAQVKADLEAVRAENLALKQAASGSAAQ